MVALSPAAPPPVFTAPAPAIAAAHRAIGSACGWRQGMVGPDIAGFTATRSMPLSFPQGTVVVRQRDGARFAFLVKITAEEPVASCRVADVVVLPASKTAPGILQCTATVGPHPKPGGPGWLTGFGVRAPGQRDPLGFWTLRADGRKLQRVSLSALGATGKIRCHEPESGD